MALEIGRLDLDPAARVWPATRSGIGLYTLVIVALYPRSRTPRVSTT